MGATGVNRMTHVRLMRLLRELKEELARLPDSGPESRDPLKRLSADVDAALGRLEGPDSAEADLESLEERLREAQERFVTNHPNLAAIIGSVLNTLSGSGL
jgi:hypothetical protein